MNVFVNKNEGNLSADINKSPYGTLSTSGDGGNQIELSQLCDIEKEIKDGVIPDPNAPIDPATGMPMDPNAPPGMDLGQPVMEPDATSDASAVEADGSAAEMPKPRGGKI